MALTVITDWGSSEAERAMPLGCDALITGDTQRLHRAVTVAAPAPIVYRWLTQLRLAPYSYDWLDNFGRRSPRRLVEGLPEPAAGQRALTVFRITEVIPGSQLTMTSGRGPRWAISYVVIPIGESSCRLVMRLLVRRTRSVPALTGLAFAVGDLVMARRQLLTIAALAEAG